MNKISRPATPTLFILSLLTCASSFAGDLFEYRDGPGCKLYQYVDKKWQPADLNQVSGMTFTSVTGKNPNTVTFKLGELWYVTQKTCVKERSDSIPPNPSSADMPSAKNPLFSGTNTSYDVKSLDYMPHQGHFEFRANETQSINNNFGSINQISNSFTLGFFAGILTEGLRVGITEQEVFGRTSNNYNSQTGVTNPSYSNGPYDPTLLIQYRYLQNPNSGFSGDVEVDFIPNIFTNNLPEPGQTGSSASGYYTLALTLPTWWTFSSNQIGFTPTYSHLGAGSANVTGTQIAPLVSDASSRFSILIDDRYHVNASFFVQGSFTLNFSSTRDSTFSGSPTTSNQNPFYVAPKLILGYKASDAFLIDLAYNYQCYTSTTTSLGMASTTKNISSSLSMNTIFNF